MHPIALAGLLVLPNAALPTAPTTYIQAGDVTRAVVAANPELAGASVELPAAVSTREAAPELEAGPVERWSADTPIAHVRVRCVHGAACRPFYATVHLSAAPGQAATKPKQTADADQAQTLRPGAHAALVIDSGRIHLRIPVTCLGGGAPGAPIRVAGPKNARVYQATVVDGTTVRGVL